MVLDVLDDFFALNENGAHRIFQGADEFMEHFRNSSSLKHSTLQPLTEIVRKKFRDCAFENVAISHVVFKETTFTNCAFRDCLMVGTEFADCEFHTCSFENCNSYKFRLRNVYLDPSSFSLAKTYRRSASNIGVELFQKLYDNSMDSHQTNFAAIADVERRRWRRHQWKYDIKKRNAPKAKTLWNISTNWIFDVTAKYGYGPFRFLCASGLIFLAIGWLAHLFWNLMGIVKEGAIIPNASMSDSLYYSMLLMTTLGFSDLLPASTFGKFYVIFCAIFGISWMALFTAILVKRVIR